MNRWLVSLTRATAVFAFGILLPVAAATRAFVYLWVGPSATAPRVDARDSWVDLSARVDGALGVGNHGDRTCPQRSPGNDPRGSRRCSDQRRRV